MIIKYVLCNYIKPCCSYFSDQLNKTDLLEKTIDRSSCKCNYILEKTA